MRAQRRVIGGVLLLVCLAACGSKATDRSSDDDEKKSSKSKGSTSDSARPSKSGTPKLPPSATSAPTVSIPPPGAQAPEAKVEADTLPSFALSRDTFHAGDKIEIVFNNPLNPPEGQKYWVSIGKADAPDSSYGTWHYIKGGSKNDSVIAPGPGAYEVRLHDQYPKHHYKVIDREKITIEGAKEAPPAAEPPPPPPPAPPPPPPPASDGYSLDGWPTTMDTGHSKPPSLQEWSNVKKEVTVAKSDDVNCETKVLREWLRVSCRKNRWGNPTGAKETATNGQQALWWMDGSTITSLVVEVREAKSYSANFQWTSLAVDFHLKWPRGGRPEAHFDLR